MASTRFPPSIAISGTLRYLIPRTAFLVFGGSRLFPSIRRSEWYALFWVLPTLIGVPAIFATVAYYQRKFNETGRASRVPSPRVQMDS